MTKHLYLFAGLISLGLGAVGAAVPLLPAFPFLLLASICFAKSSDRLYQWFIGTKLYKDNLESFVHGKGMTKKAKVRVVSILSLTMAFGFLMMKNITVGRIILLIVWFFHVLYFAYGIKTLNEVNE
ncbi:MAG: YbaN family protein [Erysipelotrichaceae bacterium]|nr:YbaN family protein [Erysipelotrichaceae bacterium]